MSKHQLNVRLLYFGNLDQYGTILDLESGKRFQTCCRLEPISIESENGCNSCVVEGRVGNSKFLVGMT